MSCKIKIKEAAFGKGWFGITLLYGCPRYILLTRKLYTALLGSQTQISESFLLNCATEIEKKINLSPSDSLDSLFGFLGNVTNGIAASGALDVLAAGCNSIH